MRPIRLPFLAALVALPAVVATRAADPPPPRDGLVVSPAAVTLRGRAARQQLIVTEFVAGRAVDRTRDARFSGDVPGVAAVSAGGVVTPTGGDGAAVVTVTVGGRRATVPVRVADGARQLPVTFERDVVPVLT